MLTMYYYKIYIFIMIMIILQFWAQKSFAFWPSFLHNLIPSLHAFSYVIRFAWSPISFLLSYSAFKI